VKLEKLYHKCGYPVFVAKQSVFPATKVYFVDGNEPFMKGDAKRPRVINRCPECGGTIVMERLLSNKPEISVSKGPSGYMTAKI